MSYRFADSLHAVSKLVEFHSKNKFEKLMHLVGLIIRNYKKFYARLQIYFLSELYTLNILTWKIRLM